MLLMDRNFNPFAISIKQAHIINGNIYKLRYGALRFFLTQVSLKGQSMFLLMFDGYPSSVLQFSHAKKLLII